MTSTNSPPARSPLKAVLSTRSGQLAALFVLIIVVAAVAGPLVAGEAANRFDPIAARQGPSAHHLLGTDDLGRDVLARLIAATRLTIVLSTLAIAFSAVVGYAIGLIAAMTGGRTRTVVTACLNLWLAFPPIVVALFVSALYRTTASAVIAVGLAFVPLYARTMLNLASSVVESDYIHVTRLLGLSRGRRLRRHIIPNVSGPLWIQTTTGVGDAMVALSALSFLGLGVRPPGYDWGSLLAEYLDRIFTDPVVIMGPAGAITLVGIMFAFIGESGARSMDPRRWTSSMGRPAVASESESATPTYGPARTSVESEVWPGDREQPLLQVRNLEVTFAEQRVLRGISFHVNAGEVVGVVGESGSGKSMTASAIAGLVPAPGAVTADRLQMAGVNLLGSSNADVRKFKGTEIATVFQNPMAALTPSMRLGRQMTEASRLHLGLSKREARGVALAALREVQLTGGPRILRMYPNQLSGGMRQRVVIAMGLMTKPSLLIADEPTTALDVTIQAEVLALLRRLQAQHQMGILFISHDFGVIREICDRVIVMRDGEIVEELSVAELESAEHPYTRSLLKAVPDIDGPVVDRRKRLIVDDLGYKCEESSGASR